MFKILYDQPTSHFMGVRLSDYLLLVFTMHLNILNSLKNHQYKDYDFIFFSEHKVVT